MFKFRSSMQY